MPYVINPVVTINDIDYSGDILNGVTATAGRLNVDEQPRAGYCNINIIEFDTTTNSIEIDYEIEIKVDDSSGNPVVLWTGWVAQVTRKIRNYGEIGFVTEVSILGVGSLGKLNRRLVGGSGYPKEFDGDRILAILKETAGETWAEVNNTLQWQNVNPLTSYAAYDILIGTIDTPGDYELKAYSGGATNGFALAQTMANSGLGLLYECNCGKINYDSFGKRLERVLTDGFLDLETDTILAAGLTSNSSLNDLLNSITITYKNGQTESGTDQTSIAIYGEFGAAVTTELEKQLDAEQRVNYYLETRAYPRTSITGVTLVLSTDNVSNTLRDDLLGLYIGLPISIPDLPPTIYPAPFNGFVEGYSWQINRNELFLALNVSDFALSQIEMNWLQVPAAETWNTINPSLDWANARSVS